MLWSLRNSRTGARTLSRAAENPVALTEEHQVKYFPEPNLYGIQATEGIVLEQPSSVTLHYKDTDPNSGTVTLTPLTEVPKTQPPSAGEYRVDYDADTFFGTSLVELNTADLDRVVVITYKGTGAIVKSDYVFRQLTSIPTRLEVAGHVNLSTLDVSGDVNLSSNLFLQNEDVIQSLGLKTLIVTSTTTLSVETDLKGASRVLAVFIGGGQGGGGGGRSITTGGSVKRGGYGGGGRSGDVNTVILDITGAVSINCVIGDGGAGGSIGVLGAVATDGAIGGQSTISIGSSEVASSLTAKSRPPADSGRFFASPSDPVTNSSSAGQGGGSATASNTPSSYWPKPITNSWGDYGSGGIGGQPFTSNIGRLIFAERGKAGAIILLY